VGDGGEGGQGGDTQPVHFDFPVPDWQTGDPSVYGFDPAGLEAAADVAEANDSYCLLVIRHGAIVFERYFNGANADTKNKSFSIAKSYTSTLVGIAIERGDIESLDQSAADFIPEWQGTDKAAITIRHLVTMTSGLEWSVFSDYVSMVTFSQDHSEFALEKELSVEPGSEWTYDNGAVQVLEVVFRGATGGTIEQYAEAHLWSKIGMEATWAHDPSDNPTTYANVLATCRDHARFGNLYLHGGEWDGTQVVPADYVAAALSPSQEMNRAYGYLFWLNGHTPKISVMNETSEDMLVPFAPNDLFAARGFGNQFIDVIPSLDLMIVRFGRDPQTSLDFAELFEDAQFDVHEAIVAPILGALEE
jgi:CubicO group peptidase (beta-lactamase class C family)